MLLVTSDLKKDKRTIEETLADIRARKKLKANGGDGDVVSKDGGSEAS